MSGPIRVMCVEDNPFVSDAIGRKLAMKPQFEWLGCACALPEVLAMVERLSPHVVCMDYHIPGLNTSELIARLRAEHPGSRVLMVTAHISEELVNGAIDAGAWGYLSKADDPWSIVDSIQRVAAGEIVLGAMARSVCYPYRPRALQQPSQPAAPAPAKRDWKRWLPKLGQ